MRKDVMKVLKEGQDIDIVKEKDPKEGMIVALLMTMWEVKTDKPQESDKEEVSQGHTKEGLAKQMLNVIIAKDSNIIVLNVETLLKILRRKSTMLKIETKAQLNLLLVYKSE